MLISLMVWEASLGQTLLLTLSMNFGMLEVNGKVHGKVKVLLFKSIQSKCGVSLQVKNPKQPHSFEKITIFYNIRICNEITWIFHIFHDNIT